MSDNIVMRDAKGKFISGFSSWNKGISPSDKTKKKISDTLMGSIGYWRGKKLSKEHKLNIGLNHADFSGKNSPVWKGGKRKHQRGYVEIWSPDHPNKNAGGYVMEHRLVMEEFLDRYLTRDERIHHINGNKTDNRIENLKLFKNISEHAKYHRNVEIRVDALCILVEKLIKDCYNDSSNQEITELLKTIRSETEVRNEL